MSDAAREFTKYSIWGAGTTDQLTIDWPVEPRPGDDWCVTLQAGKGVTGLRREDVEELRALLTVFLEGK